MKKVTSVFACVAVLLLSLLQCMTACAEDYSDEPYYFKAYNVDINVLEDNTYEVTETLDAHFNEERHGIYREIPVSSTVERIDGSSEKIRAKVSKISVNEEFAVSKDISSCTIQIGSESETVIGDKSYEISYLYKLGEDKNSGFDEVYYNIIGNNWDTYIENVTFKITMPKEFDSSRLGFSSGAYGTAGTYNVNYTVDGNVISGSILSALSPYEALTVRLELDDGYFYFNKSLYAFKQSLLVAIPLAVLITVIFLWAKFGKDKKPVKTVEFYPPDGMSSADVAFARKGLISGEQVVPLLIELANEGYVQIIEKQPQSKHSRGDFEIKRTADAYNGGDRYKEIFFNGLFKNGKYSQTSKNALENDFYLTLNLICEMYNSTENRRKVFVKNTGLMKIFGIIISCLAFAAINLIAALLTFSKTEILLASIGTAACVASFLISLAIRRRTDENVALLGKIEGFRDFLEAAEKEKLEALVNDDPQYFYNILPYTYVLGISDKWIKKFESIAVKPAEWYCSPTPFNYFAFSGFMRETMKSASNAMASAPQSVDGGSFSSGGGGFSGGGAGGGGGGSW